MPKEKWCGNITEVQKVQNLKCIRMKLKLILLSVVLSTLVACKQEIPKEYQAIKKSEVEQVHKEVPFTSETVSEKTTNVTQPKPASKEQTIRFVPPVIIEEVPEVQEGMVREVKFGVPESDVSNNDNVGMPDKTPVAEYSRYESNQQEPEILTYVDEPAQFPGGTPQLIKYLQANIKVPTEFAEEQGKCFVRFVVEKDGSISNVVVLRGVVNCSACDYEAIRVIKQMPKWSPGKSNGKEVRSFYTLPIKFVAFS